MCFSINHQDFLPENLHMVTICSQSSVRPKKKNSTPPWVTELITVGLKSLHALCQSRLQHVLATPSKTILNHQMKSLNGCVTIIPYKSMDAEIVKFHANTETNYHLSHWLLIPVQTLVFVAVFSLLLITLKCHGNKYIMKNNETMNITEPVQAFMALSRNVPVQMYKASTELWGHNWWTLTTLIGKMSYY